MKGAIISVLINALVFASTWFGVNETVKQLSQLPRIFCYVIGTVLIIALLMSLAGTLVYRQTRSRRAGFIAIVGFLAYMPIGLIGAISLRKEMDRETDAEFTQSSADGGKVSKEPVVADEFRYSQKQSGLQMMMGFLCIIVMFFLGQYYMLAIGSLPLVSGFLFKNLVVLKFRKDLLELKIAPLASTVYLKYTDIQGIKADAKKVVITLRQAQKPIHLYLNLFDKNQREDIVLFIKKKIKDLSEKIQP